MIALMISTLLVLSPEQSPQSQDALAPISASDRSGEQMATSKNPDEGNNVVCRNERIMGSNRSERVCMTPRQRETLRANARDARERRDESRGDGRRSENAPPVSRY